MLEILTFYYDFHKYLNVVLPIHKGLCASPSIPFGEEALDFPYGIELHPRDIICKQG